MLLTAASSPYAVTRDLTVSNGATLTIESGVDLNFQARIRLIVNGTLKAIASSREREIVMHHNATVGVNSTVLRLVGGTTPREGRIEVFDALSQNWGTVCDDFWNRNNAKVVCRELGFNDPIGSDYITRRFGAGTGDIGLSNVDCDGVENSLLDCRAQKWNNNTCKHKEDIGVVCGEGSVGFWGGITFRRNGVAVTRTSNGGVHFSTSSVLQNVRILNAGIVPDRVHRSSPDAGVSAITATEAMARMTNVTILDSRSSGIQLNNIHADIDFEAVAVRNCSGTGLTGQSSRRLTCFRCHVENCNQGGININRIPILSGRPIVNVPSYNFSHPETTIGDKESYFVDDRGVYFTFKTANRNARYYFRVLETSPGYGLTVSFDRFLIRGRGYFRIINGYTGFVHLSRWASPTSSNAVDVTTDSHQLVINFETYFLDSSDLTGDIKAYVSRYPLDSRQVNFLDCSTVRSVSSYGLQVQGSLGSLRIAGHKAIDNGGGGMQISGNGCSVQIETSVVQYGIRNYNYHYGIYLNGYFSLMKLFQSRVSDHRYGVYWYSSGAGNVSILDNVFNGSRTESGIRYIYTGLSLRCHEPYGYNWLLHGDRTVSVDGNVVTRVGAAYAVEVAVYCKYGLVYLVSVRSNVFTKNKGRFYFYQQFNRPDERAIFSGNRFEDNDVGSGSRVVELNTYAFRYSHGVVIVEKNTFVRNKGQIIVLLSPSAYYNHYDDGMEIQNVVLFRNNTIKDNVVYGKETYETAPNCVLQVTRSVYMEVYHNVFSNPGSSYEVGSTIEGTSSLDKINFTLNYWGTADELLIQKRLFDFDDSNFLITINYFPFLLSADLSDVAASSHPRRYPPFINSSGDVGGQLNDSATLTLAGSPYLISKDVTVLPPGTLTIEAGVVIRVKANTGILIEGSLLALGSSASPVTIREQLRQHYSVNLRIESGRYSGNSYDGTLQLYLNEAWRTICLSSNVSYDYTSFSRLSHIACKELGYTRGSYSSQVWYPSLGTPIITRFSCPGNATGANHCTFRSGQYSASSRCLSAYNIICYDQKFGRWAGIRFSPTSTISVANGHQLPSSVLQHTLIQGAGKWGTRTLPSVRALLQSPILFNVTIKDSAATALYFVYVHKEVNLTEVVVDGSRGDGISFIGPRTGNLFFDKITVRAVTGSAIRVRRTSFSPRALTDYQSICSAQGTLNVSFESGTYLGLHQDDHLSGIYCSVKLRGPPNTFLSLTLVSVQLYSDDRLVLRNGPSSSSPTIRTYSGHSRHSIHYSLFSSGNSVFVEITTGNKSNAPGFSLYAVALSTRPVRLLSQVSNVNLFSVGTGITFDFVDDGTFFSNLLVENCSGDGIFLDHHLGFFSLKNSVIRNSRGNGLRMLSMLGDFEIFNNEISGGGGHGIFIGTNDYYYRGVQGRRKRAIYSNRFSECKKSGIFLDGYDSEWQRRGSVEWKLSRNVFDSNQNGVSYYMASSDPKINGLTIFENLFLSHTGFGLEFGRSVNARASIDNNTFIGHRGSTGGAMLLQGTAQNLNITRNLFQHNAGKYVVKLSPYAFTTSPFVFRNNRLINNTINSTEDYALDYGASAVTVVSLSPRIVMEKNEFTNPESQFELGIQIPAQSSFELLVNVSSNYWGTVDEATIRDRIVDFGYCSRLANADFFPYLMSPSGPAVSLAASRDTSIVRPNSVVRGRVSANTTIPLSGSPYTVVGDITVLPGQTLLIEAGVELRFTTNRGMMVEGRLLAQGTENLPIKFVDNSLIVRSWLGGSEKRLRLIGAVPHEGVAEIFHSGTWGTICALQDDEDRFYQTYHNYYASNVVCRELGYSGANSLWPPSRYVNSSYLQEGWLEHLLCRGSESVLQLCVNYVLRRSKCYLGALLVSCQTDGNNRVQLTQSQLQQPLLHWTGIRFSQSSLPPSVLSHAFLSSAGYANAEKVAAIQAVGHRLVLKDTNVTGNAWTGVEIINSPAPDITRLDVSVNEGTGLRLSNTLSSTLKEVTAVENRGHGLALASGSFLQNSWNYPVVSPVDICAQSGKLSASTPFYLRYVPKLVRRGSYLQICKVDVEADANHVLSLNIMAVQFQNVSSKVVIDGHTVFNSSGIQLPGESHHYVTKSNISSVSTTTLISDSNFDSRKDFVLIYVQQHPMGKGKVCLFCNEIKIIIFFNSSFKFFSMVAHCVRWTLCFQRFVWRCL